MLVGGDNGSGIARSICSTCSSPSSRPRTSAKAPASASGRVRHVREHGDGSMSRRELAARHAVLIYLTRVDIHLPGTPPARLLLRPKCNPWFAIRLRGGGCRDNRPQNQSMPCSLPSTPSVRTDLCKPNLRQTFLELLHGPPRKCLSSTSSAQRGTLRNFDMLRKKEQHRNRKSDRRSTIRS